MISWWWLRHGPTHARGLVGWTDLAADLSDHAALSRLRAFLPQEAVLVSSDLIRAADTAEALSAPGHLRLPPDPAIREFNFGEWETLDFDEVAARDPELALRFWQDPGAASAPGGECWNDLAARVADWVDAMHGKAPRRHVIAVAHFGVILTQLQRAMGISAREVMRHRIDNLSVTRIDWDGSGWQVGDINYRP